MAYERIGHPGKAVTADGSARQDDALRFSRVHQFLKYHIWSGSCANVTCPSAMQDGAARLLSNQLALDRRNDGSLLSDEERIAYNNAYDHLTSRDPNKCWTSGQWMTERTGGSDVGSTETLATLVENAEALKATDIDGHPLGPWRIDGFKWFSSATDSNMAILLARTPDGNISTFFAPTRRINSNRQLELNGLQLQRLKSKLGTHPLPTAELVLSGMRAWRLGTPGAGTKEIGAILNITRIHTAMTALGYWGRGLAINRAFARVRKVAGGRRLCDVEAHVRTMAANTLRYRSRMMFVFFAASLMGQVEHPSYSQSSSASTVTSPPQHIAAHLFRLLTPLAKAVASKECVVALQECMESMGGVGYLENDDQAINIARLFRDANALPIWEGTTDVLGTDIVRVLKQIPPPPASKDAEAKTDLRVREAMGRWIEGETSTSEFTSKVRDPKAGLAGGKAGDAAALTAFAAWVATALCAWQGESRLQNTIPLVAKATRTLLDKIRACSREQLGYEAREVMWRLTWIVCSVLLVEDARRDGDEVAWKVADRWVFEYAYEQDRPEAAGRVEADWMERSKWDRRIVFEAGDRLGLDGEKARL